MKNEQGKRIDWIDTLRGIAMFLVIYGHTFPSNKWRVRKYIYSFHMPIFFFISGLVSKRDLDLDIKTFLKKKVKSLLIPYIIINIISLAIIYLLTVLNVIEYNSIIDYIFGFVYSHDKVLPIPCEPSWFIVTLFLTELLFYYLHKISKDNFQLFMYVVIMGIIGYVNSLSEFQIYGLWHFESMFTGIVFYFIGYFISENNEKLIKLFYCKRFSIIMIFLLGISGLLTAMANGRVSMHTNVYGSIILFYISSLCTIFSLSIFIKEFVNINIIFTNIGKRSIFFLAYHNFIIKIFSYYYGEFYEKNSLHLLLLSIIITIILFPLSKLAYKYCPILIGKISNNAYDNLKKVCNCVKINNISKEKK